MYFSTKVPTGDTTFYVFTGDVTAIFRGQRATQMSTRWQGIGSIFISQLFLDPEYWSSPRESNPRPPSLQSDALPTELTLPWVVLCCDYITNTKHYFAA